MLKKSVFSPARPLRAETRLSPSGILDTRETYLANMPQPVLQRATLHERRTKRTAFLSILRRGSPLVPDVQAIEVLLCRNGFSAAC